MKIDAGEYLPITHAQKRIWYTEKIYPDTSASTLAFTVKHNHLINMDLLEQSINITLRKNDGLRLRMIETTEDGLSEIKQYVSPFKPISLDYVDFSTKHNSNELLTQWLENKTNELFKLTDDDLFCFTGIRFNENQNGYYMKLHHSIFDGWSLALLLNEINHTYTQLEQEIAPDLTTNHSYLDYIGDEKSYLESAQFEKDKSFWLDKLLPLPEKADLSFTPNKNNRILSCSKTLQIQSELRNSLHAFCQQRHTSLFQLFMAALSIYISRAARNSDVVVGMANHNRALPEHKNMIGMFVSSFPLRIQVDKDLSFNQLLEQINQDITYIVKNHGKYPFDILTADLREATGIDPGYLLDINLVGHPDSGDADTDVSYISPDSEPAAMSIHINPSNQDIRGVLELVWDYQSDLFSKEEIDNMQTGIVSILNDVIDDPDKKIALIELVSSEEKQKILNEFNNTVRDYYLNNTIHALFEEKVNLYPSKPAVIFKDTVLTYTELNSKANQLARLLKNRGIKPGQITGIMVEPCLEMITGILAVLKAGGAYLPIDPAYPADRINYMLEDSGAKIMLTQEKLGGQIEFPGEVINLDNDSLYQGESSNLIAGCSPSDLAYIIYTSGTTGKPKGVMIEHRSLVNMSLWNREYHQFTSEDNCTKYAGFGFDASVFEIFPCIISGAALHVIPAEMRLSINELNDYFDKNNITYSFLPTQMAEQFMRNKQNKSLRYLWAAGEKLKTFDKQNYKVINGYGPTEYTIVSSAFEIDQFYSNIPIGKPVANTSIYILDENSRIQPIGLPGELCVAGAGIARGYLNRPDLTADKFVDDPFVPGEKMYKTGDLARWRPDGNIEFLGRIDQQLKLRGFRIELGEIETHLMNYSGVSEASVVVHEDKNQNQYLCAYYVSDMELETPKVKEYLGEFLPEYMIPAYFVCLDKIPLTANGKVDKRMLPLPQIQNDLSEKILPDNEIQRKIAVAWEKVLGYEEAGIYDNFFSMGGHSLKAITLVAELQQEFDIGVKDIFNYQDIAGLAEKITPRQGCGPHIHEKLLPAPIADNYPVSSAQARLYFLYQMGNMGISYNIPMALLIQGELDLARLSKAIDSLVARHESLRTSFDVVDSETVQIIHDKVRFKREFREGTEDNIPTIINDFIRPFNLNRAPLFRIEMIKVGIQKHLLLMDIHHIIFDGSSVDILMRELWDLYAEKDLDPVQLQYKDYAVWQQGIGDSNELKSQEDFWLRVFSGDIPTLNLYTDNPRPSSASFAGDTMRFSMGTTLSKKLNKLVNESSSTMFTVLLAACSSLLARYSSQEDIVIGIPSAGRTAPGLENIIGMFVNSIPVRSYPEREKSFLQLLDEVKALLPEVYDNQDYQLESLIEKLGITRDNSRNPLFDVMFSLRAQAGTVETDCLKINSIDIEHKMSKFDLSIEVIDSNNELSFEMEYRTDIFNDSSIKQMGEHFLQLLESICDNPFARLKDLQLTSAEEQNLLLLDFNDTKVDYPHIETIQELFEKQVQLYPDNKAVVFKENHLTYEELNRISNQLARLLRSNGVKSGDFVGILVEPCLEMITAIMAVLKAGAAYIPMDPVYPPERIKYMLDDSDTDILLTQNRFKDYVEFSGVILDLQDKNLYQGDKTNLDNLNKASDLAYIIYTSGTTGQPKGVMVEHHSLVNLALWSKKMYEIGPDDHCSKYAGFSFDAGIKEIFSCLAAGAELHIIPQEIRLSPEEIDKYFSENSISIADLPTPMAEQFMISTHNTSLRYMVTGGDKLKTFSPQAYTFVNEYGPTEFTVVTSTYPVEEFSANIPIGKPVPNCRIYILDKEQKLQPLGVPGELCIAGQGLARGYLNREDLTAEKFITDPFNPEEKMYRTGDLARWLPTGDIEFLGRIDRQVQIRGFRVELGEIEAQIMEYQAVHDAVVIDRQDQSGNTYLCAYMTGDGGIDVQELKKYVAEYLPAYMIPSYFTQLEQIPLTPNGKVDRRALPEPVMESGQKEVPRNIIEQKIASAWEKVLSVKDIGINDSFFDIGGNSLKAVSLVTQMQKEFNVTINDVFKYQTIAEQADNVTMSKDNLKVKLQSLKDTMPEQADEAAKALADPVIQQKLGEYRAAFQQYTDLDIKRQKEYNNILLTGVTGYLGIHILRELLEQKQSHIYLPVRAINNEEAKQRIVKKMLYYFGEDLLCKYDTRITVFKSELAEKNLGLEDDLYDYLSKTIDCIINSAANVKHWGHFDESYQANVQVTKELLVFAETLKKKDFHQISTVSVGEGAVENCSTILFTEDSCDNGQQSGNIYLETKLDAEKEVINARDQGVMTNIYRIGNITFDSKTGIPQENLDDNAFYQIIRAYSNLGIVPEQYNQHQFSFADQVAKAIVLLFDRTELLNHIYHLENTQVIELADVLTSAELGLNVKQVNFDRFIDFLITNLGKSGCSEYIEHIMLHHGWLEEGDDNLTPTRCIVYSEKTDFILGKLGFTWPVVNPSKLTPMILKSLAERIDYLRNYHLFSGLTDDVFNKLGCSAAMEYIADDDYLFWEGDSLEYFYLILDGHIEISRSNRSGWTGTITVLHAGDFVGEESIVSSEPSATTATALLGDVQVLRFDGETIKEIMQANPKLGLSLLKAVNTKVQNLEKLLINMA